MSVVEIPVTAPVEQLTEREQRARTLEAAALEIAVNGWAKCDYSGKGACANGAIGLALGWTPTGPWVGLPDAFVRRAGSVWGRSYSYEDLANYNDATDLDDMKIGSERAAFILRWRAEEIRDGWDA